MVVPESLGGDGLLGYMVMEVRVTKDGSLHGYRIGRIEVSPDTLHWYVYSPWSKTATGDSLIRRFQPWIDQLYGTMRSEGAERDSMFLLYDSLWYSYHHDFGQIQDPK
jgi:hypothetical protein